ncbi:MAG: hypothetical protein RQ745_05845 [Longimicrobiales bacterium]|nr:hypothetical protein [Longimicrobiales bacterium]
MSGQARRRSGREPTARILTPGGRHRRWAVLLLAIPLPLRAQAVPLVLPVVLPAEDIGEEHYGDPPSIPAGERWMGLYADADTSWLQEVEVRWERREGEELGGHTYVVEPATPLLLLVGVPQIRPGPAETVLRQTESTYSGGSSVDLPMASTPYTFIVSAEDPDACDATVTLSDGERSQVLFTPAMEPFSCDGPHFDLHWAGDLDGDRRLDLLATFSLKYSSHPRRLFLSSAAAPGALVGEVALFRR